MTDERRAPTPDEMRLIRYVGILARYGHLRPPHPEYLLAPLLPVPADA